MEKSQSVAAELIRLVYRHVPAVVAANLINSSLVVAALWESVEQRVLLGWVTAVIGLTLARAGQWLYCRHRLADDADAMRLMWRYMIGVALSGLLWGSTAFLFMSTRDHTSLILVSFVIGGMGAGAVTSLSAHMPAFYLFLLGSMLPFTLRLLTLGERATLAMSGMAVVYVVGLIIVARNLNAALVRALVLNEENTLLLKTREREVVLRTADLQAANADLEREIAERKRAEEGLQVAHTEAERANQAKSRFLAAASHDLRQPLQSLFLFATSLRDYLADRKGIDILDRIERGLDILKGMLDSLLDLSRLEVNVIEPRVAAFPLGPMLDDVVAAYRRIAASKGIELCCGERTDALVRSDPSLLGRMVRNLVENAIRYTEQGKIILSSHLDGDRVRIAVQDTGIGIAADQLGWIFEEFHQLGNPERDKAHGLGLGLAIVQRLSGILGHPVGVRSEVGVGSTFSILVPTTEHTAAAPDTPAFEMASGAGRQVIVVDDDPMVLLALRCIFEQWNYGVTMAGSEDEAVRQLRPSAMPDLIVADYRLRDGRIGTDAIKGIRAGCGVEIPSILLTGETGSECLIEAESVGALVLHKPVTPHDLAFAMKGLTDQPG